MNSAANGQVETHYGKPVAQEKFCPDCKRTLPRSEWGLNPHSKDRLQSYCKRCFNRRDQKYAGRAVVSQEVRAKRRIEVANAIASGETVLDVAIRFGVTPSTAHQFAKWCGVEMVGESSPDSVAWSRPRATVEKEIEEKVRDGLRNKEIRAAVRMASHRVIAHVRDRVGIPEPPAPPKPESPKKMKVLNRAQMAKAANFQGGATERIIGILYDLVHTRDSLTTIGARHGCTRERARQVEWVAVMAGWKIEDRAVGGAPHIDRSLLNGTAP